MVIARPAFCEFVRFVQLRPQLVDPTQIFLKRGFSLLHQLERFHFELRGVQVCLLAEWRNSLRA